MRCVIVLVLILTGGPHTLFAQDSESPVRTFSEPEEAALWWISNSNAGNGLSMIAIGVSIPVAVVVSPGIAFWVALIATGFQAASVTSTAVGYTALDSALAKEGKDLLRPGAPIVWSYVSVGSFVAATFSYLLAGYLGPSGLVPELLSAVFLLTGEISAIVTFFATSGYVEMIRQREQESSPGKAGWSPDAVPQLTPCAATFTGRTDLGVRVALLSIRY